MRAYQHIGKLPIRKRIPTIPGVEHVCDEVVNEGDLRFGHTARVPVEHRHHHGQSLPLLLICLQGKKIPGGVMLR